MRTKRLFLPFLLVCAGGLSLHAQESLRFSLSMIRERLNSTPKAYDTTFVRKVGGPWILSLNSDLILTGLNFSTAVTEEGLDTPALSLSDRLHRSRYMKAGASVTYGPLQIGAMVGLDPKGTPRDRYNHFSLTQPYFGIDFHYYSIHDYLDEAVRPGGPSAPETVSTSEFPGLFRNIVISAYGFFTPRHFCYSAVSNQSLVQRRSGGSWMTLLRYTQGEFAYDLKDRMVFESVAHVGSYRSAAVSLGGGYSFNWVPLHRDATDKRLKGLRNLTLNLTLMPGLILYDHLQTTVYKYPDEEEATAACRAAQGLPDGAEVSPEAVAAYQKEHAWDWRPAYLYGRSSLTLSARAGLSYSWDRFFVCATADFNRFTFRGFESVNKQAGTTWHTGSSGSFFDLTASIHFNLRF